MPRNPSELARLEEELGEIKFAFVKGYHSKGTKDRLLARARSVGAQLGVDVPDYNSNKFSAWLRKGM